MVYESVLYNDLHTNGIIGPHSKMLGPVADGGKIVFLTPPGCWGPMITPNIRGGHEVNVPVSVEKAEIGNSIAIFLEDIKIKSRATSSGVGEPVENAYMGDPFVFKICPSSKEPWPDYEVVGIGDNAVKCKDGTPASPFRMVHGYTMLFDDSYKVGITVDKKLSEEIAKNAKSYMSLPPNSKQVPVVTLAKADLIGAVSRIRPFMGQLGSIPAVDIPDSHNAGDFGYALIDANHPYRITRDQYEHDLTDGHLDIDSVRPGSIIIVPVKVKGGGIYAGDGHAMEGDGEVAGHTTDVTTEVSVKVEVIDKLNLEGPLLLPREEDLPPLAKPWRKDEWDYVMNFAKKVNIEVEPVAPLQIIGSGPTINDAAKKGFERAAKLFGMKLEEVLNRVTITGAVEIGRLPGIVQVSMQVPIRILEKLNIADIVIKHYNLSY
ncbi:MAG: acetamidase/formamidase family protein [Caldisphaera sp.]